MNTSKKVLKMDIEVAKYHSNVPGRYQPASLYPHNWLLFNVAVR